MDVTCVALDLAGGGGGQTATFGTSLYSKNASGSNIQF